MEPGRRTDEVLRGFDLLLQDQQLLDQLQRLPDDAFVTSIMQQALRLQTAFVNFIRIGVLWLRKNYVVKFAQSATGTESVQDVISEVRTARNALRTATSDDLYLAMKRKLLEDRNDNFLNSICSRDEYLHHLSQQRIVLRANRLPETADSIIRDPAYIRWCNGEISTLWCTGLAGAGKTFAASRVVDDLELRIRRQNVGLAYYFCSFERRALQSRESLLATVTRELASRLPDSLHRFQRLGPSPTLAERKELFREVVRSFEAVYIVVDALDEFSTDQDRRLGLANTLTALRNELSGAKCRLCITSRTSEDIAEALAPTAKVLVRANEAEITAYVKHSLLENEDALYVRRLTGQDQSLVSDVIQSILTKSDMIFKLAQLQIAEVLRCRTSDAIRIRLASLTSDVDDYYQATMNRINDSPDRSTIEKLLVWVLYSKHSTIDEYLRRHSAQLDPHPTCTILGDCLDFLTAIGTQNINPFARVGAIQDWRTLHQEFAALFESNISSDVTHAWVEGRRGLANTYVSLAMPLTIFFAVSKQWGDYTKEAILEDSTFNDRIRDFLRTLAQQPPQDNSRREWKPPSYCAHMGWTMPIRLLLDDGEDLNTEFVFKDAIATLLSLSLGARSKEKRSRPQAPQPRILEMLLQDSRINVTARISRDRHDCNPLIFCVFSDRTYLRTRAIDVLLARPEVDVNESEAYDLRLTPLLAAVSLQRSDIVDKLLRHPRIEVNKPTKDGDTALMLALIHTANDVEGDHSNTARQIVRMLLVKNDLRMEAQNADGLSAMHMLVLGYGDVPRFLIDYDPGVVRILTMDQMHSSHLDDVLPLVDRAGLSLCDKKNRTPLDYGNAALAFMTRLCAEVQYESPGAFDLEPQADDDADVTEQYGYAYTEQRPLCLHELRRRSPGLWRKAAYTAKSEFERIVGALVTAGAQSTSPFELSWENDPGEISDSTETDYHRLSDDFLFHWRQSMYRWHQAGAPKAWWSA